MGPSVPVLRGLMGPEPSGVPIWEFGRLGVPGEGRPLTGESSSSRSSCLELKDVLELSKPGIISNIATTEEVVI